MYTLKKPKGRIADRGFTVPGQKWSLVRRALSQSTIAIFVALWEVLGSSFLMPLLCQLALPKNHYRERGEILLAETTNVSLKVLRALPWRVQQAFGHPDVWLGAKTD